MADLGNVEELPPDEEPVLIHGVPASLSRGELVVHPGRAGYLDLVWALLDDGYQMCVELTAVDFLTHRGRTTLPPDVKPERFEVVVSLLSFTDRRRIRIRVQVPEHDPHVSSLFELHPGTEALEREVYDLFGILFDGHPDLTRILMPDDWEGHPLRKDYGIGRIPVQFKGAPGPR